MVFVYFLSLANILCNNEMKLELDLKFIQHFNFFSQAGVLQKKMKKLQKYFSSLRMSFYPNTYVSVYYIIGGVTYTCNWNYLYACAKAFPGFRAK